MTRRRNKVRAFVACWLFAGCGGTPPHVATPDRATSLELRPSAEPSRQNVQVVASGERGPYFLEAGGTIVSQNGAALGDIAEAGFAPSPWIGATEIDALEGGGRWIIALDASGSLYRLRGGGGLEPMNDRLGVPKGVKAARAAGSSLAVLTSDALFVVERAKVTRYAIRGTNLASSRSTVAVRDGDVVHVLDLESRKLREFVVPGARHVALTTTGVLVVAAGESLYRENGSGVLALTWHGDGEITALSVADERIWFGKGERVGLIDGGQTFLSRRLALGAVRQIHEGAGATWIVGLARTRAFAREALPGAWSPEVARVVSASCTRCHRPGGEAPFDLSTASALRAHAGAARKAIESGAMPPGQKLTPQDRALLVQWLQGAGQ